MPNPSDLQRVPICTICGAEIDPQEASTCEDCEPSDCTICGRTVPRSTMNDRLECDQCASGPCAYCEAPDIESCTCNP